MPLIEFGNEGALINRKSPGATWWTGSANSIVSQMVSAFNTAIAAKAKGIGCCLIDNTAFNKPVDSALSHGIPVIAYNADVAAGTPNNRQAYVGQNNLTAGAAVADQILKVAKKGDLVGGIIATPGTGNIQPRIDGAKPVLEQGRHQVRGGRDVGDRGVAGVQQDLLVVRRPQGREVHVRGGQRRQQRPRAAHPEEQPEGQGRRGGVGSSGHRSCRASTLAT